MRLRFLAMGSIASLLGAALLASRGLEATYAGLLIVGVALLVIGLIWK